LLCSYQVSLRSDSRSDKKARNLEMGALSRKRRCVWVVGQAAKHGWVVSGCLRAPAKCGGQEACIAVGGSDQYHEEVKSQGGKMVCLVNATL
jgi:hypothetical protein